MECLHLLSTFAHFVGCLHSGNHRAVWLYLTRHKKYINVQTKGLEPAKNKPMHGSCSAETLNISGRIQLFMLILYFYLFSLLFSKVESRLNTGTIRPGKYLNYLFICYLANLNV